MVVLTAVNSLAVIGLVVVLSWLAGLLMWETFKRYVRPRLERRRWLREYNRQKAIEYATMLAQFAPTPAETAAADYFFTSGNSDPLGHLGDARRYIVPGQEIERGNRLVTRPLSVSDIKDFIPSHAEQWIDVAEPQLSDLPKRIAAQC